MAEAEWRWYARGEDAILSITRRVSVTFNLAQELLTFRWPTCRDIWYLRFRRASRAGEDRPGGTSAHNESRESLPSI